METGSSISFVGAPYQTVSNNLYQGAIWVFSGSGGKLLYTINDPVPQAFAEFGSSAASVSDISGDGKPDIIVGSPYQNVNGVIRAGEAFLFNGTNGSLLLSISSTRLQPYAGFGFSVAADLFQKGGLADPLGKLCTGRDSTTILNRN